MSYQIHIRNKELMRHGIEAFDKKYFGIFFRKYNLQELMFYYRWFRGWIGFLDNFLPLKNGQGKKALEIGCGIGAFAKILDERGFKVTATDISAYIIKKARKNLKNIDFQVMDIEKDLKIKNQFDYIFAFEVLEHLQNPVQALKNMKRMLNRKGMLIFSTPYPTKETLADPMHINVNLPNYWLSVGKRLGFKTQNMRYASFIPFLYRFHHFFSRAIPFRINLPYINNTCFFFFERK